MTSTTDTAGHPDVTEISDLTEGLLTPPRTTDVRRHLDECVLCADVYASLEEIRGLLGSVPGPARMPDDIAARIDDALAAEAPLSATVPHVSRETSTPADRSTDRPTGHAHAATGPGRKGNARRGRRRTIVLSTVFTAAALGLGSLLLSSLGDDNNQPEAASTFSGQKVENQVTKLLKSQGGKKSPEMHTTDDSRIKRVLTAPDCVMEGIGRGNPTILGVDEGTYGGTDAYLVVLPAAGDNTRVTAYVVDSACVTRPSVQPKVLLKQSYAHP